MRGAAGYSIGWLVLWACGTTAMDVPISSNYVLKKQDSCPSVGYYFRREPPPNAVDPGPCLLCFCTEPGMAACWPRDSKRCDVPNNVINNTDSLLSRARRSPLGIADIFFRDAARDFFDVNLPQQCLPSKESFSEGCPPDDWCIGCTVCDCDANGRWDCHVLSFCNEEERKKQVESGKLSGKYGLKSPSKKTNKRSFPAVKKPTKPANLAKKPVKQAKRDQTKKPSKTAKPANDKPRKKVIKRVIKKVDNEKKKNTGNTKPPQRKIIIKKHANNKTIKQKRESPKQIHSKKLMNKEIINSSVQKTYNGTILTNDDQHTDKESFPINDDDEMSHTLLKKVMASVKKMVRSEIEKINETAHEKPDCENVNKKKHREFKNRKIGHEFRWMRSKRDVGNESTTTVYDNGIDTTTNLDTDPSNEIDKNTTYINAQNDVIPITSKPILSNMVLNTYENLEVEVRPLEKTTENNILGNISKSNSGNDTILKFQIVVNDDQNATLENLEKNILLKDKWPLMSYKYKIDNEIIEKILRISTTVKPNTTDKNLKQENNLKSATDTIKDGSEKQSFITQIISKFYRNLTDIYFPSKNISTESKVNLPKLTICDRFNRTKNTTSFLKYFKKILKKLLYFGKKSNRLGQEDEYEIVKMLCDNMKSCKINKRNKKILKTKIKKINDETKKIFKTIKIIKGLLHLIDSPNSYKNEENFKNDIKKLNAILKGDFLEGKNLSTTQQTQIAYLKSNTKTFIHAVSRFITLLNEVTAILQRKTKHEVVKTGRYAKQNMTESFDKIKKILIKHKLVENTFIKKIYSMLTDLEVKVSNKTKVSDKRNNSYVINKYSRDIVENLRKLRDLAQGLNFSRKKRHITGDDDTMEYLLILLEYLLKKDAMGPQINRIEPVVHDGIDVLIDTIKSAPDINDIKKKIIENAPQFPNVIQKVNLRARDENETETIESNQSSDSNSASKETNTSSLNDILMELKNEELIEKYSSETRRSGSDKLQNNRGILYRDSPQGARPSLHNPVKDVSTNSFHDPTEEFRDNPYHNLAQIGDHDPDLAQDKKENNNDNTQMLSGDLNAKSSSEDDINRILKENSKDENIPNIKDNSNNKGHSSKISDNDEEFTEKENLDDDGLTLDVKYMPNKDIIITKYNPDVTPKTNSNEDATQIVRAIPLEDISQNVYYKNVDVNTTNYESYDNITVSTETTTPVPEKVGFDKFENSIVRFESDSDDEEIYHDANSTGKAQSKIKNNNNNQTVNGGGNQSDNVGNLEWIVANFGNELRNLKEKFDFTKETTTGTKVKSVTTTTIKPSTQIVDISDISDQSEGKKDENTFNADEVMRKKQMDLLNSLDYGTEKIEFEDSKSDLNETPDSLYA